MPNREIDEMFMSRCLELAAKADNSVAPNPMVGAVLVHDHKIVGEGFHQVFGQAHAEVNALKNIHDPEILSKSTLYVSLEPCSHHGKTPPCADLIIEKKIPKVVVACLDPNPLVAGNGIKRLKEHGIETHIGILEKQAQELNRRFFVFQQHKRPYVILKWAQTQDGFIARKDYSSKWISSPEARTLAHQWRSQEMAILVGAKTAIHDNPSLDTRLWKGKNPIRCLIDLNLSVSTHSQLFNDSAPTLIFNALKNETEEQRLNEWLKINEKNPVLSVLEHLKSRNISSLLVEGGAQTHRFFLDAGAVDEIRQVVSKKVVFGDGIPAMSLPPGFTLSQSLELEHDHIHYLRKTQP